MEENKKPDDGSLAFLNIPRDESNRSFNCDETTQSKLVNTSFCVCDFIEDVPTRFSKTKGIQTGCLPVVGLGETQQFKTSFENNY